MSSHAQTRVPARWCPALLGLEGHELKRKRISLPAHTLQGQAGFFPARVCYTHCSKPSGKEERERERESLLSKGRLRVGTR